MDNMKDQTIKISGTTVEQDINIVLPSGKTIQVQYRNYEGDHKGNGATVDFILPESTPVNVWQGEDMKPAKKVRGSESSYMGDQIAIVL
jgi:hypothetical protein